MIQTFLCTQQIRKFTVSWKVTRLKKSRFVANHTRKTSSEKESGAMTRNFVQYLFPKSNVQSKVCKVFFFSNSIVHQFVNWSSGDSEYDECYHGSTKQKSEANISS